jgi:hypothetical protein
MQPWRTTQCTDAKVAQLLFSSRAQALFSNSKALGGVLMDTGTKHTAAITLAVLGFGLTDVSLNVLQVLRTRLSGSQG